MAGIDMIWWGRCSISHCRTKTIGSLDGNWASQSYYADFTATSKECTLVQHVPQETEMMQTTSNIFYHLTGLVKRRFGLNIALPWKCLRLLLCQATSRKFIPLDAACTDIMNMPLILFLFPCLTSNTVTAGHLMTGVCWTYWLLGWYSSCKMETWSIQWPFNPILEHIWGPFT